METFDELYYTKPYLREFDGKVVSCEAADGGFSIVLDQTAFYPTGGGQPGDRGTLCVGTGDDILVAHVREAVPGNGAGEVIHLTDVALPVGASVHGSLDWTWRRDNMEAHTGEHIVSGIVHALFGYNNVGFHMGERCIEVDFDGVLTPDDVLDVERRANAAIREDVSVEALLPSPAELAEMDDCMPHYYKVTGSHGQGAETIMRAEAAFMQGRFTDAHIALESSYAQIEGNGQENMALCCDFLAQRLSRYAEVGPHRSFAERRAELLRHHNASWLNLWNAVSAYCHALRGETELIPEVFAEHRLVSVSILAPGRPMIEMIENQVYLAQGAYAKVTGRSEGLLALCEGMHYALVALHVRLQTASAYERLGKRREAEALLAQALADAAPDGIVMPFAENYRYLKPLLAAGPQTALTARVLALGEAGERRQSGTVRPAAFAALTEREYALVGLMAQRLTNREIAEKLFLSEGSVKQYVNQIYSKLHIEGDQRTKRRRLAELLAHKS